jgi:hypothetical protein
MCERHLFDPGQECTFADNGVVFTASYTTAAFVVGGTTA